jgi:hypothetical protein
MLAPHLDKEALGLKVRNSAAQVVNADDRVVQPQSVLRWESLAHQVLRHRIVEFCLFKTINVSKRPP